MDPAIGPQKWRDDLPRTRSWLCRSRIRARRRRATTPCSSARGTISSGWTRTIFWRPDKIERQFAALGENHHPRTLLSSSWGYFSYRTNKAQFVATSLWQDLSPTEWLVRKLTENLHMQTATWLTSRELAEAAGPWDTRLISDDDGEYFCRVLLASEGTRFVPESKVFYRITPASRWSFVGTSDKKKNALLLSMKLHIQYLRSLEESERVRKACLIYIANWFENFFPERPDLVEELQNLAGQLQGHLDEPRLRWKYAWMKPLFGWKVAKRAQMMLPQMRASMARNWDKAMYDLENRSRHSNRDNNLVSTR